MKNVIIAGSTGMIGGLILLKCLERNDVSKVTTIVRKPSNIKHPKLQEIVQTNYVDFSSIEYVFKDHQVCFYCVGVYTGQVPEEEFRQITVDYTRAFAEVLRKQNEKTSFCFLSGQGADSSEKSRVMFARYKGMAENILLKLQFDATHIFRPGYIYPVKKRIEPNISYKIMRALYKPMIKPLFSGFSITSEELATAMVEVGLDGGSRVIYENNDIKAIETI